MFANFMQRYEEYDTTALVFNKFYCFLRDEQREFEDNTRTDVNV